MIWTERMGHLRNWHKVPVAGEGGRGAQGGVVGRTSLLEVGGEAARRTFLPCPASRVWGRETGGFLLQFLSLGSQALVCCM